MAFRGGRGQRGRGGPRGGGPSSRGGYGGGGGAGPPTVFRSPGGLRAPEPSVREAEDAIQASKASLSLDRLGLKDAFPVRPGYGTKGRPVVLWANYVDFSVDPKLVLYRYDISIQPSAPKRKLMQVVHLLLQSPELASVKDDIVTDFRSTLLSRRQLPNQAATIVYRNEGEDEALENATVYTVSLQHTNVLSVAELIEYITSTSVSCRYDSKLPMIQAFNIFLNHFAKSTGNLATIGSSKTFAMDPSSDTFDLGGCLTAVRGFYASVRAATNRILVNVNVSHGAFYQEGPLDQFMSKFGSHRGLVKLERSLKRLRIKTTHLPEKRNRKGETIPRIKTIIALAHVHDGRQLDHRPRVRGHGAGAKSVEFWLESNPAAQALSSTGPKKGGKGKKAGQDKTSSAGRYISVYDFFLEAYGITLAIPDMPVVNVGSRDKPTYLPAQVCYLLPGQAAQTKLDPSQTQNMIRFAVRRPADNASSIITKGLVTSGLSPATNPQLGKFGVNVGTDLVTVHGRVLAGPRVLYKANKAAQMVAGGWNMVPRDAGSLKFSNSVALRRWSCLYIELPDRLYRDAQRFTSDSLLELMKKFHAVLQDTGIAANTPLLPLQRLPLRDEEDPKLDEVLQRAANGLDLLFIVLPAAQMPLYNRIKKLGDVKFGIHTICCVGKKIAKPGGQDQYFRNEALKFNLKLGGSNQLVQPMRGDLIAEDKTMVVGIDVTHPSPGSSQIAPSVAGMVANVDKAMGQWPAILSVQPERRKEMVADLKEMLLSRLKLWRTQGKHASLPENILVYRDGVSEGQYQLVLDEELPLLRAACKMVYPADAQKKDLPRMTVVIVGKRHHTRFYPTSEADMDRSGNTKPGTVVDRGVTEARTWDFFMQAHTALQGTARPAHYVVVLDEIFRARHKHSGADAAAADELQELTQNMCYTFGRATKAVSICTPAYYADILCERARCYLSGLFEGSSNASVADTIAGIADVHATQEDVQPHEKLRNSMFYI